MRLLAALLCTAALAAADASPAVKAFQEAFAGSDPYAKRKAIKGLASGPAEELDAVIPLLLQALGDRATAEMAVESVRARMSATGVAFPRNNDPEKWTEWVQARQKERAQQKKVESLDKKPAPATPAGDGKPAAGDAEPPPADATPAQPPPPLVPTDELGKIDRIIYKNGSVLRGYVRSRRVDADNNLVSIRIVHPDGRGEEVVDAKVIARIEEDVE